MYHSGYNVKSNLEDWFGVAGRYTNLLFVLLHLRNSFEYTSSLPVRLITSSKFHHSVIYMLSLLKTINITGELSPKS